MANCILRKAWYLQAGGLRSCPSMNHCLGQTTEATNLCNNQILSQAEKAVLRYSGCKWYDIPIQQLTDFRRLVLLQDSHRFCIPHLRTRCSGDVCQRRHCSCLPLTGMPGTVASLLPQLRKSQSRQIQASFCCPATSFDAGNFWVALLKSVQSLARK